MAWGKTLAKVLGYGLPAAAAGGTLTGAALYSRAAPFTWEDRPSLNPVSTRQEAKPAAGKPSMAGQLGKFYEEYKAPLWAAGTLAASGLLYYLLSKDNDEERGYRARGY